MKSHIPIKKWKCAIQYLFSDILSQLSHDLVKNDQLSNQSFGVITWSYDRVFLLSQKSIAGMEIIQL